ncbi:MAG: hypothetical protein HC906_04050 [Bacteroidales bacterium]|nr:hypothetical protein [Bacteroidales bacterium]
MVDVLKEKLDPSQHFRIKQDDAITMNLNKQFKLIIAPFRVFSHILDTESQLTFLNNVHNHLEEGGTFIFDLFVPNPELLYKGINNVVDFEGEYSPGRWLKRTSSSIPDIVNQLLNITMKFEWLENDQVHEKEWKLKMRFYFRYELECLVQLSRLKLVSIYGDYSEGALNAGSKEFVVVCRRNECVSSGAV